MYFFGQINYYYYYYILYIIILAYNKPWIKRNIPLKFQYNWLARFQEILDVGSFSQRP